MTHCTSFNFDAFASAYAWPGIDRTKQWHVRLNMAVTTSGQYVDATGQSAGMSSPDDRRLLKIIRLGAHAIIVGAATIRAEGWNLPASGILVVLSQSQSLPWDSCPDRSRVHVFSNVTRPKNLVRTLAESGMTNILIEGGGSVARQFAADNLFDDVCLTVVSEGNSVENLFSALVGLLDIAPHDFDLISHVRIGQSASVFGFWRRAIDSLHPAEH